ncbi:hypothetical protein Taro_053543 [Colocasia esculenta]|uniref:MADS-box domain-containing protein n=1 Tax=Colocasia esculenta TaxID=4460 RepID=A0A843XMY0_COLES|nr:hypothetical protein [Colocasia esculenta]
MVRIKMPLRLIEGEKHRNMTFMKRRVVIKKKAEELSTLCDIATMLVCYGPRGQLETWPKDPREVRGMIDLYRSVHPDECIKRRYGLATFFEGHLKKLQADLARERESWLDSWSQEPLEELAQYLDAKLDAIEERMSYLGPEEVGRLLGKETEAWEDQHAHNQFQQMAGSMASSLHLDDNAILDAQPALSIETMDFSRVKKEDIKGNDLQGHTSAAGAAFWEAPHGLQMSSQQPCPLTYSAADPYMLPKLPEAQGFSMADVAFVDDLIFPNRFLSMDLATYPSMDLATYPAAVPSAGCSASVVGTLAPAVTAFPLSFTYDASLCYSSGGSTGIIGNSEELLPPLDRPVHDAGFGFSLNRRAASNMAVACHEGFDQNELYGAEFVQGAAGHTGTSLAETSSGSLFLDPPPNFCSSSESVQEVAPGGDDSSKRVPTTAKNPCT